MWSDGGPAQPVADDRAGDQWRLATSALGPSLQKCDARATSAFPPKATEELTSREDLNFGRKADRPFFQCRDIVTHPSGSLPMS
jgi:hypothetical protein